MIAADRRAALVEMVTDLVRFNHDPIAIANEAIYLIRAETLEEAEDAVGEVGDCAEVGAYIAAIRALKGTP